MAEPTVGSKVHMLQKKLKGNEQMAEHILGIAAELVPPHEGIKNNGNCKKCRGAHLTDIYDQGLLQA